MKTVLQEAFSNLEKLHPELFNVYSEKGRDFLNHFHNYIESEKSQMKEAYYFGLTNKNIELDFEDFYNNKFNK